MMEAFPELDEINSIETKDWGYTPVFLDIETEGLNPFEDRISMIGVYDGEFEIFTGDEKDILSSFFSRLSDRVFDSIILVGYNILGFDIPFITTRSIIHNVDNLKIYALNKTYTIDLMYIVRHYLLTSNHRHSQTKVYQALGGEIPEDIKGSEAALLSKQICNGDKEQLDTLKAHCINDLKKSMFLFERLKPLCELYFSWKYKMPLVFKDL